MTLLKPLLDLFLEASCSLCGRSAAADFCQDCWKQVQRCQRANPSEFWREALPLFAWGQYEGALKRSIATLKYDNQPHLARSLGREIGLAWVATKLPVPKSLTVVPIPMHPEKQRQRGFNQAGLLAEAFCRVTRLPLHHRGLARVRSTDAQYGLGKGDREHNLKDAFQLGESFQQKRPPGSILLLDDIFTTGATARSAVEALRQAKIPVCGMVTLAMPRFGK